MHSTDYRSLGVAYHTIKFVSSGGKGGAVRPTQLFTRAEPQAGWWQIRLLTKTPDARRQVAQPDDHGS